LILRWGSVAGTYHGVMRRWRRPSPLGAEVRLQAAGLMATPVVLAVLTVLLAHTAPL